MGIGPRLLAVASLVPKGYKIGDIGTDHGYLPIYLVEQGQIEEAIAGDVNVGPLSSATRSIKAQGLEQQIQTRLGSGLEVLQPGEVDLVTICGMGGKLMVELLKAAPEVVNSLKGLVLQPQQGVSNLRQYLYEIGWHLEEELLVEEDQRLYQIMYAKPGKAAMPNALALALGPKLMANKPELFPRLVKEELAKVQRRLQGMAKSEAAVNGPEYKEDLNYAKKLEELL